MCTCLCVCTCAPVPWCIRGGQMTTFGFWGSKSSHWAWLQVPLAVQPSRQPLLPPSHLFRGGCQPLDSDDFDACSGHLAPAWLCISEVCFVYVASLLLCNCRYHAFLGSQLVTRAQSSNSTTPTTVVRDSSQCSLSAYSAFTDHLIHKTELWG